MQEHEAWKRWRRKLSSEAGITKFEENVANASVLGADQQLKQRFKRGDWGAPAGLDKVKFSSLHYRKLCTIHEVLSPSSGSHVVSSVV